MSHGDQLILASASERRIHLLKQIGLSFSVQPASIDESRETDESPEDYTRRLAITKALSVWQGTNGLLPALGADTIVSFDGEILGKPINEKHAVNTLMRLSGRWHKVITSVSVVSSSGQDYRVVSTEVQFRNLTRSQCEVYCRSGESMDKAGAYAIQGLAGSFVRHISGSYSAVVGLPLHETAELLTWAGVQLPVYTRAPANYE